MQATIEINFLHPTISDNQSSFLKAFLAAAWIKSFKSKKKLVQCWTPRSTGMVYETTPRPSLSSKYILHRSWDSTKLLPAEIENLWLHVYTTSTLCLRDHRHHTPKNQTWRKNPQNIEQYTNLRNAELPISRRGY
ncbi:hypothetical protein TWF730_006412 [Orbilia blumenaviensis]|uniref:Uncharacterized protein n=1 Tax=Orbilia blumenaviensis TaxID=1796055 RepID=A0AAV9VEL9_9PEZI